MDGRTFLIGAVMLGLLAGCTKPVVDIASNTAPDYQREPHRLFILSTMEGELGTAGAASFNATLTQSLHQCGVEVDVFIRSPLSLDNKVEQQRLQQFNPDTVLALAPTNRTVDARNGAILAVIYGVELFELPKRTVWKAQARIDLGFQGRDHAGEILATDLADRLKKDGILRRCGAATTTTAADPPPLAPPPSKQNHISFAGDDPRHSHELRDLPDRTIESVKFRSGGSLHYTRLKQDSFPGEFSDADALRIEMAEPYYRERGLAFDAARVRKVGPVAYIATSSDSYVCFIFHMNFGAGGHRGDQEIGGTECWPKTEKGIDSLTREMVDYLERARFDGAPLPGPGPAQR
jgi:hypothetical protein